MKLFTQYNRINLTVTAILFILAAGSYYLVINHILVVEIDEELDNYKDRITSYAATANEFPGQSVLEDLTVTYNLTTNSFPGIQYHMGNRYDPDERRNLDFRELSFIHSLGKQDYLVTISKPLEGVHLLTRTIIYVTVAMLGTIVLLSLLLNQFVLKRLWRPFYDSMKTIKRFRVGASQPLQFDPTRIEEFSFMNQNLLRAMETAKTEYRLLKEFTENASHEVQTPLTIIRSKLDLLIQEENLSEKQIELLKSAYGAIKRISKLNQSLLLLAKIENQQFVETEQIDLKREVSEKIEQFREFWEGHQLRIASNLEGSLIAANPDLIDILLNNLLGNAGMHNRKNGEVIIHLASNHLIVSNTGSHLQLDKDRLFRRFYKEEIHSQHNGLGLSIIKQICDQSGIHIEYSFNDIFHTFILSWPPVKE